MNNPRVELISMVMAARLTFAVILIVTCVSQSFGQETTVPNQPLATVQRFKQVVDASDIAAMCEIMAEPDSSGPLSREHCETTQASLEGLITFWQGQSFSYGSVSVEVNTRIPRATVTVTITRLKQSAVFSLLRFGEGWYIRDIEIYFK